MSGATPSDAGLASGLVNTTVQVGGALGLAVLATLATTRTEALRAAGDPALAALNGGFHLAYLIGAALVLAAIVVAVVVLRPERTRGGGGRARACPQAARAGDAGVRRGVSARRRPAQPTRSSRSFGRSSRPTLPPARRRP